MPMDNLCSSREIDSSPQIVISTAVERGSSSIKREPDWVHTMMTSRSGSVIRMNPWDQWSRVGGNCPPLSESLRVALPQRWARIYNLPRGRRLPSGPEDEQELLYRNNIVASTVLGVGADCVAVLIEWGEPPEKFNSWQVAPPAPPWKLDDDRHEMLATAIFKWTKLRWRPGDFDDEILAAARGELGRLAIFAPHTRGIYCPYDGGVDVFLAEPADTVAIKRLLAAWCSDLESGL